MADTNQILHDVLARLDTLEQRNTAIERDNAMLKEQNGALLARIERQPILLDTTDEAPGSPLERMSRRWILRRGMQAAAATVVAGVLVQRETQEAHAAHSGTRVDADSVYAHHVSATSEGGGAGVYGSTNSATEYIAGVWGQNHGTGPGVLGKSVTGVGVIGDGLIGVKGTSSAPGYGAAYGVHTNGGYGVVGDGHGASTAGVLGRNAGGSGVRGEGKTGVHGKATSGKGLFGESGSGYGGVLGGGKAQLRLLPRPTTGKPTTGAHQIGELYLDQVGSLFICTAAGTPGTWKKVTVS